MTVIIMHINNTYIFDQPKLPATHVGGSSANPAAKQQRVQQAQDSYSKNAASAEIIDAEYVDLYSSEAKTFQQEKLALHQTLDSGAAPSQQKSAISHNSSAFNRYQIGPADTPLPGTYLNIFA